jgi:hypothetical protein
MVNMNYMITLRKKFVVVTINVMLSVIILLGLLIIPVHATGSTIVKVDSLSQSISSGSTFTISIACVPNQTLKSFELQVIFNPSLLKANSVSEGNIFKSYSTFFNAGSIDNVNGTINNIYDLIIGTDSISSSGTLITISFTAKSASGTASINLENVGITDSLTYIPITSINGSVQITAQSQQSNQPPVYESTSPANNSSNIPISTTSLKLTIRDPEGKPFSYTIQALPNVGSISVNNAGNGTKSCTISGLKYATTYRWYVNSTDGINWKQCWYTFTTAQNPANNLIIFSETNPSNGTTNVLLNASKITITVQNTQGHTLNMEIKTSPDIGSGSLTITADGTNSFNISNLAYNTSYQWYVLCKDLSNGQWTNQSYWFRTETNPANSNPPSDNGTTSNENEPPSTPEQNNPPNPPTQPTGRTFIRRGVTYTYTSSAFDPDNDPIRLRFDWGDGTYSNWTKYVSTNTTISLSHKWRKISSYNISVIAQDENGVNSSWSDTLSVTISSTPSKKEKSVIDIKTTSNKISVNKVVQFNASTSYIPDDAIVSYHWLFGDGEIQAGKTAVHTYTAPGQYTVSLTIINTLGEIYNKKINITIDADNQLMALSATNFIFSNLTIIIIGTVVALICILLLFSRKKKNLQFFKKYIALGQKWITQRIIKISGITHSIFIKLKQILKIANVKVNRAINTFLQYTLKEKTIKKNDDNELAYIHWKLDQIIMND